MTETSARDIAAGVTDALAKHDRDVAQCPVRNPRKGQRFTPECGRCGAGTSDPCALAVEAGYTFVAAVRAILQEPKP